ncbi:hypothetical protein D3C83_153780 [compost metagenome]
MQVAEDGGRRVGLHGEEDGQVGEKISQFLVAPRDRVEVADEERRVFGNGIESDDRERGGPVGHSGMIRVSHWRH